MSRVLIKDLEKNISKTSQICGHIDIIRNHGGLSFIKLRDYTGSIQCIIKEEKLLQNATKLTPESAICVNGVVIKRPEGAVKKELNGSIEFEIKAISQAAIAKEMPFDREADLNLDVLFDYRPLTLRRERERAIFKTQMYLIKAFREFLYKNNFTEFQCPKIVGEDAEGGAGVFPVDYFKQKAYLATSPQLYKQILVPVFERVFTVGNVYRAEKHSTTRHVNEYTSLDIEMGFIEDHNDVMDFTEKLFRFIDKEIRENIHDEINLLQSEFAILPETPFPKMTLLEAQEKIAEYKGKPLSNEDDFSPEDERDICEYAKERLQSDFVFITEYPASKRPAYTCPKEDNSKYTKSFDLLFRGVEILTGGQRVHIYEDLLEAFKKRGLDPNKFDFYLQTFKYGCPKHGGFGLGVERLTAKYLGLKNTKEAVLFPRDLNRIDKRLVL